MNADKDPEFTAPEGNGMGECLIPRLYGDDVRYEVAHISPQLPTSCLPHSLNTQV